MKIITSRPASFSELGQKANQEDALWPSPHAVTANPRVLVLCDGMGGHAHGEVASRCVAHTVGELLAAVPPCPAVEMNRALLAAVDAACDALDRIDDSMPDDGPKMGTTLVVLAFCTDGVLAAHIGDSRIYQLRPGEGVVFQSRDHSLVNDLIAAGELTPDEARSFPQKNVITRALQPHQEFRAKPSVKLLTDVRPSDVFLLCCDGVTEQLTNNDLCRLLLQADMPLPERVDNVRKSCAEHNTRDNHTCWAVEVTAVGSERADVTSDTSTHTGHRSRLKWLILTVAVVAACFAAGVALTRHGQKPSAPATPAVPEATAPTADTAAPAQGTIHRPTNRTH